jgi:hypothetical protein
MLWSREVQQIAGLRDDLRALLLGDKVEPVSRPSDPPQPTPVSIEDKADMFIARQRMRSEEMNGGR